MNSPSGVLELLALSDKELKSVFNTFWTASHGWGLDYEAMMAASQKGIGFAGSGDYSDGDVVFIHPASGHELSRYMANMLLNKYGSIGQGWQWAIDWFRANAESLTTPPPRASLSAQAVGDGWSRDDIRRVIQETLGFDFEPKELQEVSEEDLMQLGFALTASKRSPSYEALLIIAQAVCGGLARAGITDCDNPGEAIDLIRERAERAESALATPPQPADGGDLLWVIGQARALLGKVRKCDTVNNLDNVHRLIDFMDSRGYKSADKIEAPVADGGDRVGYADVLASLRNHVESNFTTQAAYALSLHVSPSYVSDVLNGRREIPADWVFGLGYRKSGWERFDSALAKFQPDGGES